MRLTKKSRKILAAAAIIGLASSGAAYAYWTTTGSGSGTATTGTSTAVVVTQTSDADNLYPDTSVALSGNFNNSTASAQYVTAVTASVDTFSIQTDVAKPACTEADFEITGTSNTPGSIPVGSAAGAWSGLSIHMINAPTNQDNCQGLTTANLTISYTAN